MKSWSLWSSLQTFTLSINVRAARRADGDDDVSLADTQQFCQFLTDVGDGLTDIVPNTDEGVLELPPTIVSNSHTLLDFIRELYPDLDAHHGDCDFFAAHAILTPTNANVDLINRTILSALPTTGISLSP